MKEYAWLRRHRLPSFGWAVGLSLSCSPGWQTCAGPAHRAHLGLRACRCRHCTSWHWDWVTLNPSYSQSSKLLLDAHSSSLLMWARCLADRGWVWPGAGWHVLPVDMEQRARLSASGCPPLPAGDWCSLTSSGCPAGALAFSLFLTIFITPSPCFYISVMQ